MSRVHHFAALTGGVDVALVMLLDPAPAITTARSIAQPSTDNSRGVRAYARLQAALFDDADLPNMPILPLARVDGLATLLGSHLESVSRPRLDPPVIRHTSCTSQAGRPR